MVAKSIKRTMAMKTSLARLTPHLLSVLRIVAAFLFIAHGTQKLLGFPPAAPRLQFALSLMGAAGVIETVGGSLMLLGLFTRPVAFVLSGQMAVAYFIRHAPGGTWPIMNGGELAVLFCFVWLLFVAAGPGPWSLDKLRKRA
jgi:putative oxidoreductase